MKMATNRTRRTRKSKPIADWLIHFFIYGTIPEKAISENKSLAFRLRSNSSPLREKLWKEVKDDLLKAFTKAHPCQRPWPWWDFDAPRWKDDPFEGWYFHGKLSEPRKRLGGIGKPDFECWSCHPYWRLGVPANFEGVPIEPDNPPTYESQSSYLKRHGLLTELEKKRLKDKDFSPESVLNFIKNYEK